MTVAEVKPLRLKNQRVERKLELSQNVVDVLVDTPIHHLDQLYTYAVPQDLDSAIQFGVFLAVDFNGRPTTGIAIEKRLRNSKDAHLSPVKDLINPETFMNQWQWEMINSVAEQYMASRNAILRFAIPQPSRVKKIKETSSTLAQNDKAPPEKKSRTKSCQRIATVTNIGTDSIKLLVSSLKKERSALVIVPDERDLDRMRKICHDAGIETKEYGSHNSKNSNLTTYLAAIANTSGIYIGTRMAVWLPVSGPLYMLNDVSIFSCSRHRARAITILKLSNAFRWSSAVIGTIPRNFNSGN
jgi:primosomal protein N' (replication factor Y)